MKVLDEMPETPGARFDLAGAPLEQRFLDKWRALGDQAADPNVFHEPWMMGPALDGLAPANGGVGLFTAEDRSGRLAGAVPLVRERAGLGRKWSVWSHTHCFDNTPLVRQGECRAFLEALFGWLERQDASVFVWPALALDTAFSRELADFLATTGRAQVELRRTARPLLLTGELTLSDSLGNSLSRSRRRGAERRQRRLSEKGRLSWSRFEPGADMDEWCRRFLELEAGGWKGRMGTAMGSHRAERTYFQAIASSGAQYGRILMTCLELDGTPIAMTVNFRKANRIWAFKTAYNEAMSAFAPGVLAEIEDLRLAIEDPTVDWADSCTYPGNRLLYELWPHRRPLADLMIAVRPGARRDLMTFAAGHFSLRAAHAAGQRFSTAAAWAADRCTSFAVPAPRQRPKKGKAER